MIYHIYACKSKSSPPRQQQLPLDGSKLHLSKLGPPSHMIWWLHRLSDLSDLSFVLLLQPLGVRSPLGFPGTALVPAPSLIIWKFIKDTPDPDQNKNILDYKTYKNQAKLSKKHQNWDNHQTVNSPVSTQKRKLSKLSVESYILRTQLLVWLRQTPTPWPEHNFPSSAAKWEVSFVCITWLISLKNGCPGQLLIHVVNVNAVPPCDHFHLLLFKRGQFRPSNTVDPSPRWLIFLIYALLNVDWLNADHLLIHQVLLSHVAQTLSFCCSIVFICSFNYGPWLIIEKKYLLEVWSLEIYLMDEKVNVTALEFSPF